MDAILLACGSAALFGAMTVALRLGLRSGVPPEAGSLLTILPALVVIAAFVAARDEWGLLAAWPFVLAGTLAPGVSQILFTFAVMRAGPSRTSVTVGTAPLFSVAIALVFLGEPVVAGLVVGAVLIVGGGVFLLSERRRPEHFRGIGLAYAVAATVVFATRDSLIRRLGTHARHIDPGVAVLATVLSGAVTIVLFLAVRRVRVPLRAIPAFLPAGLCSGISYICLFEAFYRGRVTVVSPLVATESLWGVGLSVLLLRRHELVGRRLVLGAVLVVVGGVLIGAFR